LNGWRSTRSMSEKLTVRPSSICVSDNANRSARASREITPPTLRELEKALKAMPHGTDIEKRDRAIFAFMIVTCVKDDSLVSLKIKDVDATQTIVW